jgi:hypothetical protein
MVGMTFTFILLAMLFMHVLDDYVLQAPALCNLKQKSFWEKNAPEKSYRFDYIVALIMHAISWSFMIMLPCAFALDFNVGLGFAFCFILNTTIHATVDHLKANVRVINLWVDQTIHLIQIMITFVVFYFGGFIC